MEDLGLQRDECWGWGVGRMHLVFGLSRGGMANNWTMWC